MQIYLARNNQQAGPYSLEQVNEMLASQQVLLTDLAWHEGMTEWKALGELTQGKLVYEPAGYVPPRPQATPFQDSFTQSVRSPKQNLETLASYNSRALAKIIDLLLWLPAFAIPSLTMTEESANKLMQLQQKSITPDTQSQILALISPESWQMMGLYIAVMLIIQSILIAKTGQSIGKRLTNIQIVDQDSGAQVNMIRGFWLRSFLFIILNFLFMPFITILDYGFAFSKSRQTLHDKLAKTKVIRRAKS
ncbi:RDD family protein [Acinetobacter sp. CAAS 2-6]|uniref:RDD family protein n=1 Tax=Acinetobacter sp. CAAS 2-6 TaxID=3016358 RepID=UPI002DD6B368|nr:RDD family protein [Acinetobacter sp. CAAS 2-6]